VKEQQARKASKWWANQLTKHSKLDMGNTEDCAMPTMLGCLTQTDETLYTQEQADVFEKELSDMLTFEPPFNGILSCDYGPCRTLRICMERAGLEVQSTTFPWKTVMWIEDDKIIVKEGYTAERKEI